MNKIFGPFFPYSPLPDNATGATKRLLEANPFAPFFYEESTGKDYYEIAEELKSQTEPGKYAFLSLDLDDRVCCVCYEGFDGCTPFSGWKIAVVPVENLPKGIEYDLGDVVLKDGKFSHTYFRSIQEAKLHKDKEIAWASQYIQTYEDYEQVTGKKLPEHMADILKKLKIYRCEVLSIKTEDAPNITWAIRPSVE